MKQNSGRLSAFILGFLITIMLGVLVSFVLTSLYRMENTMSPNEFSVLNIEKNMKNGIEIIALNKKYIFDFSKINQFFNKISTYDVLIPSEIRAFFCAVDGGMDAVGKWVYRLF